MTRQKTDFIFNTHGLMEAEAEIACHPANVKFTRLEIVMCIAISQW
jgi:hypothetical protein